ncbi:hypothetical protein GUJ93_ZPchr0003g16921 [Zizania palustris]|uniref:Knottin scorpion toxin-like domain-containing protein n=1 Tax=Zizania palustris TaxID=103762 RepID=A0A8J5SC55_ZIZPA|nr:hypothetical protein GUJ93_ZPchr0003g16921 [Zizania palustris]
MVLQQLSQSLAEQASISIYLQILNFCKNRMRTSHLVLVAIFLLVLSSEIPGPVSSAEEECHEMVVPDEVPKPCVEATCKSVCLNKWKSKGTCFHGTDGLCHCLLCVSRPPVARIGLS